jgi:small ligand-binding sensory domain FIST
MKFEEEASANLTAEQCEELAAAITEEAVLLSSGSKKEALLKLAQSYLDLAAMKGLIARKLN